jgi:FMN-dependent NADH-azoreductase
MSDVLMINSSPRGPASESLKIADELVGEMKRAEPHLAVDRLDLFADPQPPFGVAEALAKMDVISGREVLRERRAEWERVLATADRLAAADVWVLTVPMWNSGIPWALKQLIDTVTQPGVAFSFDPELGYSGLLSGRVAVPIYTSHVYRPGSPPAFGVDHHSTYLDWWLGFIGVEKAGEVRLQTTYPDDGLPARRAIALGRARALARTLAADRQPARA